MQQGWGVFNVSVSASESDNESIPTPCKNQRDSEMRVQVKSLEELKLEQIQKQDAALYHYQEPFDDEPVKVLSP